jgi:hypothetical protein
MLISDFEFSNRLDREHLPKGSKVSGSQTGTELKKNRPFRAI